MPKLKLDVRIYEDNELCTTTETVTIAFDGHELVSEVENYITNLLFRRATRSDSSY